MMFVATFFGLGIPYQKVMTHTDLNVLSFKVIDFILRESVVYDIVDKNKYNHLRDTYAPNNTVAFMTDVETNCLSLNDFLIEVRKLTKDYNASHRGDIAKMRKVIHCHIFEIDSNGGVTPIIGQPPR